MRARGQADLTLKVGRSLSDIGTGLHAFHYLILRQARQQLAANVIAMTNCLRI